MKPVLHITGGDCSGASVSESGIPGEVFVWHDVLYEGPRKPGWPDVEALHARAAFLEETTGGGLSKRLVFDTLKTQYAKLKSAPDYAGVVLWFDACLFDQAMLSHILACMRLLGTNQAELLCLDAFPGIVPFHGLGQLSPDQLASVYDRRQPVTEDQFRFAERVDRAFALQDWVAFEELSRCSDPPLPWIPAAVSRWLLEQPNEVTGLGRLEQLALDAVRSGCSSPTDIFSFVSGKDTPPQFWGDTTLWAKINRLAERQPPLVKIEGPKSRLPQWDDDVDVNAFRVRSA